MTLDTIFAFLLGCLVGFLLAAYVMTPRKQESAPSVSTQNLEEMLKQQMAFIQTQNMLRSIQLEQAKQEAEFRTLDKQRNLFLSSYPVVRND